MIRTVGKIINSTDKGGIGTDQKNLRECVKTPPRLPLSGERMSLIPLIRGIIGGFTAKQEVARIVLGRSLREGKRRSSSRGEVVMGLLVMAGLVLLVAAGGMLTQYIRTQVLPPEQERQQSFKFTVPDDPGLIGEHSLQFTATDGTDTFTSDPVRVVVTARNTAPTVAAGEDITVKLPREASLTGTVTDDGLPLVPGEVTINWSKVSGPGAVTFSTGGELTTTAALAAAGTYVLRLTADDGQTSAGDDVTVTVEEAPPAPDLSLQADRSKLVLGDNVAIRVSLAEATPFANWAQYLSFDRTKLELVDQQSGDYATFIADTRGLGAINSSGEVRSGGFSLTNSNSGTGSLGIFTFKAVGVGQTIVTTANKSASKPFGNVLTETDSYEILPDIVAGEVAITIMAENSPPAINAGPDQQIRLPINRTSLNGAVSDDGLPDPPATVTVQWSKVSGPGTVTLTEATQLETEVVFSQAGVYVLQLQANDSRLASQDETVITVREENGKPVAAEEQYNAWQGEALNVGVAEGVLKNDTDPDGDQLTAKIVSSVQHGQLSLSANGSFYYLSENSWRGIDSFTYQAFDGIAASEPATVEINVGVRNAAPKVQAGNDMVVNLPNAAILLGKVTDDGEPAGQALQIKWSKISGPGEVVFTDEMAAATSATFNKAGDYILRLQASDGGLVSADEVAVNANTVPIGQNDRYEAFQNEKLTVASPGVLVNDADENNDALSVQLLQETQHGDLTLAPDGSFTYLSDRYFAGTDSFAYVLSDSKASAPANTVELVVAVRNAAPQVSAGADLVAEWGGAVQLSGTVSDDGKPEDPGQINILWSKISGPGEVSLAAYDQAATTVSISLPGTYVLRLSASDGVLLAADEVTITVHSAPQVAAGEDLQPLINETVKLEGTITDDGLPAGASRLVSKWVQVSGPTGQVEIISPVQAMTNAIFKQEGEYVLRLMANDGNLTSWDEVTVKAVARQATIEIPGLTRLIARPGDTIEVPFVVRSNILNKARLLLKLTVNVFLSEIK